MLSGKLAQILARRLFDNIFLLKQHLIFGYFSSKSTSLIIATLADFLI
nr:hypothetical protein [uncultured Campylobacter sp.]